MLANVEGYPGWYPEGVRSAEVLERDPAGVPTRVKATLHIAQGPIQRDFKVHLSVTLREPELIALERIPHGAGDREQMSVTWRLAAGSGTALTVELAARLSIPAFMPVGGLADSMARGFLDAAVAQLGR